MRFLRYLNKPTIVLLVLGLVVIANGFLFYRQQATSPSPDETSSGDRETPSAAGSATDEIDAARYAQNVGDIQNAAVQASARINERRISMFPRSTKGNTRCSAAPSGTSMLLQR